MVTRILKAIMVSLFIMIVLVGSVMIGSCVRLARVPTGVYATVQ